MAFFDTLKQNLMTASQVTMDKSKNTAEILKKQTEIKNRYIVSVPYHCTNNAYPHYSLAPKSQILYIYFFISCL